MLRADPLKKYLDRHAEPEARLPELEDLREHGPWTYALTIPARRETIDCLAAAAAPAAQDQVLTVLVVNAGPAQADRQLGAALLESIEARARARWQAPGLTLHRLPEFNQDILLVDRCRPPRSFGERDGVGLARKLGADLIAQLIAQAAIRSPWIHTTDADARLPANHFQRVASLTPGAAIAPFEHVKGSDPATDRATLQYEQTLRAYVKGLRQAGSPYAFHTIGSLISVACSTYAQARGFPRRQAGEDFYMLNKLAKLAPIHQLQGAPVQIKSRRSTRAPFGTGPAVEALLAGAPLEVYDPKVFQILAQTLAALTIFAQTQDQTPFLRLLQTYPNIPELKTWHTTAQRLATRYPIPQHLQRFHEHFDAFRTLKLIHALTTHWPKIPWAPTR